MSAPARPNWWVVVGIAALAFLLGRCEDQGNSYDRGFDAGFELRQPSQESARGGPPPGFVSMDQRMASVVPERASSATFIGYECTSDCSGHEAGYAWAEENDITDPDMCDGNSNSFIEGCIAWAEEN